MMELENLVLAYNLQFFAKDGPGGEKTEPATRNWMMSEKKDR
mgnify:CR=1 FL=1